MMVLSREHHECGLEPVVRLAEQSGLPDLVGQDLRIMGAANSGGANPAAKVMSLVAAMAAGADSVDDIDRLRHGGMGLLFDGTRAPSTAGKDVFPALVHSRPQPAVARGAPRYAPR
jgi:hypothetical protein